MQGEGVEKRDVKRTVNKDDMKGIRYMDYGCDL